MNKKKSLRIVITPGKVNMETAHSSTINCNSSLRVSAEQRELMLAYMIEHPTIASRRIQGAQVGRSKKLMWEELAKKLNACQRGSQKTAFRWCKDWRSDIKQKALKLQKNTSRTDEGPVSTAVPLTAIEKKLLSFIEGKTVSAVKVVKDPIESQTDWSFPPLSFQSQEANEDNKASVEGEKTAEEDPEIIIPQEENFAESQQRRSHVRKIQSGPLQFTNQLLLNKKALGRLEKISNSLRGETEFEIFGRSLAAQLSQIPLVDALELQLKIQTLLTQERLRVIKENS